MTKYQFEVPDEEWARWKDTVSRSKNLDVRIRELLAADADGRVLEEPEDEPDGEDEQAPAHALLEDLDIPGQGQVAAHRRRAVARVHAHVREQGRAPKDELVEIGAEIAGDTYADKNSLWKNLLQPALSELEAVESEGASGYWRTT